MTSPLSAELLEFVARELGVDRARLHAGTTLGADLGVDGDDAAEFFDTFSRKFGVNLSGFSLNQHFGPEAAFNPIYWLFTLLRGHKVQLKEITLSELQDAVSRRAW